MPSAAPMRIAIVSDDVEFREELSRVFADTCEITMGSGDPMVLGELRAATPAAIVLDLDLLAFDGFELLRLISADTTLRGVPVVTLSSSSDFATFERAHRFDAAEFVTKPLRPSDLRAKVLALAKGGRRLPSGGRLKLGAVLVAGGMLSTEQVERALKRQHETGRRLGELLVEEGTVSEQEIVAAVAGQMRIGVADLSHSAPQANAISLLPRDFIVRNRLMPLSISDDGSLVLAMTNPLDVITIDEVSMRVKRRVVPVICTESSFDEAVAVYFSARGALKDARDESGEAAEPAPADVDAGAIELVDAILSDATGMGASDVHLESREDSLHVRCRIDGVLHELREFPKDAQAGILSRLKIMGNIDIAERRPCRKTAVPASICQTARPSTFAWPHCSASTARTSPSGSLRHPPSLQRSRRLGSQPTTLNASRAFSANQRAASPSSAPPAQGNPRPSTRRWNSRGRPSARCTPWRTRSSARSQASSRSRSDRPSD